LRAGVRYEWYHGHERGSSPCTARNGAPIEHHLQSFAKWVIPSSSMNARIAHGFIVFEARRGAAERRPAAALAVAAGSGRGASSFASGWDVLGGAATWGSEAAATARSGAACERTRTATSPAPASASEAIAIAREGERQRASGGKRGADTAEAAR